MSPRAAVKKAEVSSQTSKSISVTFGNNNFTVNTGDLTSDTLAQFAKGSMSLVSDVLNAAAGKPISTLTTDVLRAGLSAGTTLGWSIGNISLQFAPSAQGEVIIRKSGEIFRCTEAENDDDASKRQIFNVPSGQACVSIALRVNIGVAAAGGFSNGALGVKGSAQLSDTFLLANHVLVPQDTTVGDALRIAFGRFVIPFKETSFRDIVEGDFVEYQFFGKLDVAVSTSLGFGGVIFGGISGGDLRRSFGNSIGSITAGAKPDFNLGASFTVKYQHEDAFRIVLQGQSDHSRLFLFKMDQSALSAGLKASASARLNGSVGLQVQAEELIDKAAAKVFASEKDNDLKAKLINQLISKIKDSNVLDKYVQEAEDKINDQIRKIDKLKVAAAVGFERISEHATLLSIDFDRNAQGNGYKRAINGDMVGCFTEPGTTLAPGSYTRSELRKTTSMSLQLFETFSATSIQTYFEKSEMRYAGNGIFQLRFGTGVTSATNVFGHRKAIDFYFEITADTVASGAVSDKDINLHIITTDDNNTEAARRTASMLHLILQDSPSEGLDDTLRHALQNNPSLKVKVDMVLAPSAYQRLRFTPFIGNKPGTEQTADAQNYAAFVKAIDLIYAGSGFLTQGYPDQVDEYKSWARYNVTATDREGSTNPPNRRERGNSDTDSVWPQDSLTFPAATLDKSSRRLLLVYMLAAQEFMNFCEDLPKLSKDLDQAATRDAFNHVLDEATNFVNEGAGPFPLFFTKPLTVTLLSQCAARVTDIQAPPPEDGVRDSFDVCIKLG